MSDPKIGSPEWLQGNALFACQNSFCAEEFSYPASSMMVCRGAPLCENCINFGNWPGDEIPEDEEEELTKFDPMAFWNKTGDCSVRNTGGDSTERSYGNYEVAVPKENRMTKRFIDWIWSRIERRLRYRGERLMTEEALLSLEFGALVDPLIEQLVEQGFVEPKQARRSVEFNKRLKHLQLDADALSRLRVRGYSVDASSVEKKIVEGIVELLAPDEDQD